MTSSLANKYPDQTFSLKIGIATGGIIIADIGGEQHQQTLIGESVTFATRICQFSGDDQVLVGEETCHATHISDPHAMVSLLNKPSFFKNEEMLTSIEESNVEFAAYPNPSTGQFLINYNLPYDSFVTLKVYNMLGEEVAVIQQESKPAGIYTISPDLSAIPPGIYLMRMDAGEQNNVSKLVIK